jgi:hypothetical protein
MRLKSLLVSLAAFVALGFSGCVNVDPFSSLDYCYLADWTNHHSHLSCCKDNRHP